LSTGQVKLKTISIFCFSAKHAALRNKSKYWLAQKHDNMSKWSDLSTRRLLFSDLPL